jgi:hypothetical protein
MRHCSYGPRKKRGVVVPTPISTKNLGRLLLDWQLKVRNAMGLALNGPRNIIACTAEHGANNGGDRAGFIWDD